MISATIEKLIDQVVLDRIAGPVGQSFSAYDITKDVRKLTTEIFYHGDAKDYIHAKLRDSQMFDVDYTSGSNYILYSRNATVVPIIVNNPNPVASLAAQQAVTIPGSTLAGSIIKAFNKVMKGSLKAPITTIAEVRTPDARGTISIPKEMVKSLGLQVGDKVTAHCYNSKKHLILKPLDHTLFPHQYAGIYTVDRSGNIRVTKPMLERACANRHIVTLRKDSIVVE